MAIPKIESWLVLALWWQMQYRSQIVHARQSNKNDALKQNYNQAKC